MENLFDAKLKKTFIFNFMIINGALIALTIISAILFRNYYQIVTVLFSLLLSVSLIAHLAIAIITYMSNDIVKNDVQSKTIIQNNQQMISKLQNSRTREEERLRVAKEKWETLIDSKNALTRQFASNIHQKIDAIEKERRTEIQKQLEEIKSDHIKQHLQKADIWHADIPGFSLTDKGMLKLFRINNASHINQKIWDNKYFSRDKIRALVNWRNQIYKEAELTQPDILTVEQLNSINVSYDNKISDVRIQETKAHDTFDNELQRIKKLKNDELVAILGIISEEEIEEKQLRNEILEQERNLELHKDTKFYDYIKASSDKLFLRKRISGIGPVLVSAIIIASCITSGVTGTAATSGFLVSFIPTSTYTPTITPTNTNTPTETNTPTKTNTNTPTKTQTPTKTKTPTITNTPTITYTSTITPTSTNTMTLTPTLRVGDEGKCIPSRKRVVARVSKIISGNTIEVSIDGKVEKVQLIGVEPPKPGEYYREYSKNAISNYMPVGSNVILIPDDREPDRGATLLRYVIAGSMFVNYQMIAKGHAYLTNDPCDCKTTFTLANTEAKKLELGIYWPIPEPTPYIFPTGNLPVGNCHPSYPGNCFPYPPDLDCGDIWQRNFVVLPPDPHRFDGDHDGIGCEE